MRVYTYYAPTEVGGKPDVLIDLWYKGWSKAGWEPHVLGPVASKMHGDYEAFDAHVRSLPTINPKEYEVACFHRWLALEVVNGGVMTDYDVMNYGFTPEHADMLTHGKDVLFLEKGRCPCTVFATKGGARQITSYLGSYAYDGTLEQGRPHLSDMHILKQSRWLVSDVVREFGDEAWEGARLVHFANGAVHRAFGGGATKERAVMERRPV
jgi:hypothetical protein